MAVIAGTFYGDIDVKGNIGADGLTDELMQVIKDAIKAEPVAEASKLETPRNISVGTAVSSTPTAFDGSKEIEIPINSVKEAYLAWGGKSISGALTPIDTAATQGANRFAFANANGINIEYSRDGGTTWQDYGASNEDKTKLVSGITTNFYIGGANPSNITTNDKLRITLTAGVAGIYAFLRKILINISREGASGSNVLIERSFGSDIDTFATIARYNLEGWSGWNSIPINNIFGTGATQWARIRLTFSITGLSSTYSNALSIRNIVGLAEPCYRTNSTLAKTGHLYEYDASRNARFPAEVYANGNELVVTENTLPFKNVFTYNYGAKASSFSLESTSKQYIRIATGKVQTTSEITISLPTGANYYYIGYWTSPYANSSATNYSNSISGYMPSTTTSRGIATIKASSSGTAPFLFIYWQPL